MTNLVQIAPNGIVVQGGWYPAIRLVHRPGDGAAVLEVADWRGGKGGKPPVGFVTGSGALTAGRGCGAGCHG